MTEPRRKHGRPRKSGERVEGAGISLRPSEIALLDRLVLKFAVHSRGDVVRRLIADHPEARKEAA